MHGNVHKTLGQLWISLFSNYLKRLTDSHVWITDLKKESAANPSTPDFGRTDLVHGNESGQDGYRRGDEPLAIPVVLNNREFLHKTIHKVAPVPQSKTCKRLSLVLLSDSTGATVQNASRAAICQFSGVDVSEQLYSFIRDSAEIDSLFKEKGQKADLVLFTVADPGLKTAIEDRTRQLGIPAIGLIDPLVAHLSEMLDQQPEALPGQQYTVDQTHIDRVESIDFAISNDDGRAESALRESDVILTGVSRTSKTPTCIYLGYQGIKASNVPLIPHQSPPDELIGAIEAGIPVVGLIASASRLAQLRQTRLKSLGTTGHETYSNRAEIEEELIEAQLFFEKHRIPVIDVTRRSIEETAATIRNMLRDRDA